MHRPGNHRDKLGGVSKIAASERRIVTFRWIGDTYRRSEEMHEQQLFAEVEVLGMLRSVGFDARSVRNFGDFHLTNGVVGFVARKPQ